MQLQKEILGILGALENAGYEAFVVGGAVRDSIMGNTPLDIDITTNASPKEIKTVFKDFKTVDTGIKHGTVTLVTANQNVEITTYRIKKGYSDSRHPDYVEFSKNLKDDLARRDFTINAICYNPKTEYIDVFGGIVDIKNKIIRTVGNPKDRFLEDALRILRGVRFAATLGFSLEDKTALAAEELKYKLKTISAERIFIELKKALTGSFASNALNKYYSIFKAALPEIAIKSNVDFTPFDKLSTPSDYLGFSLFIILTFEDNLKATAEDILKYLKVDKRFKNNVLDLISLSQEQKPTCKISLQKLLFYYDSMIVEEYFKLGYALDYFSKKEFDFLNQLLNEIITDKNSCYNISHLDISGNDVKELGISARDIGLTLKQVLFAIIENKCQNKKQEIIKYIKSIKKDEL